MFFPPAGGSFPVDLRGAYLVGADGVPVRGELKLDEGVISCDSRNQEALGISLLWPIPGYGLVQLETTRLLARAEPFHLHIELARHRLMRISMKREEWGLFDYSGMDRISDAVDAARDLFIRAMQATDDPAGAARLADQSIAAALRASDEMCKFHASVFLQRRQQSGGFTRNFLGTTLLPGQVRAPLKAKLTEAFDFVRIPFIWREIQPKEQGVTYEATDAAVKTLAKSGLALRGGPLLNFGIQFVPDWMYIWENDYEAIVDFAREHVRRTVQRYSNQITQWVVASGLHAEGAFAFNFEQIMDLSRMAATIAKQTAPRCQVLLDLTQPWGEYYARNQRTIPPPLYAEMAVQSGIPFDAYGLQFVFGIDAEGYHLRDMLQISSLIDRLANLGKPLHITAVAVPIEGAQGGSLEGPWSPVLQAQWYAAFCEIALSKPYVETVALQSTIDSAGMPVAGSGVFREDGAPKLAFTKLSEMRAALQAGGRK